MEIISITYTYNIKHFVSDDICVTECGKYINVKKGIELKKFLNGKKVAIYINGKATNLEDLKPIKRDVQCPF